MVLPEDGPAEGFAPSPGAASGPPGRAAGPLPGWSVPGSEVGWLVGSLLGSLLGLLPGAAV